MPSLFTRALHCCCLRPRPKSPAFDDESSRLIPPESDVPSYTQPHPIVIDHQKLKERLGAIVRMKEGKMLNVGASSPLNLHRKALQSKLNPSASNSSRSMIAHRSFQSSTKSVTLGDHSAADLQGANNHRPHPFPQNSSLVSFQTEGALPNGDGHGCDRDSPTVLNIRLASGGVYGSERSYSRGRSSQRTYVSVASDSEEEISRSSAPSHKTSVSPSRSPPSSRVQREVVVRKLAVIARSWKDE